MTRAEEAALKAYPKEDIKAYHTLFGTFEFDSNAPCRTGFEEGYKQAEKDTIERAIEWLKTNAKKYIVDVTPTYPDAPQELIIGGKCWDDLRKAMEEQK